MKKRLISAVLALAVTIGMSGCEAWEKQEKIQISMYLWDKSMSKELTPWLEEQFPDIEFTFAVGYNTMDFYTDMNERGILPDIITCRRFSLNDAAHMSELLMDLSQTEVVGTFYDSYIENNREPGGAIRWLPMCAEVDGYIANKDLFEEYGIPLPADYGEFAEMCRSFEEHGIIGYVNDYHEDYSCMEALQGCAIPDLMSIDGTMWRMKYESETDDSRTGLDEKVWRTVFEKFEKYIEDTRLEPESAETNFDFMKSAFVEGRAAIIRGTASDCATLKKEEGINSVMLPYFGETSEDNWLLTYPTCQVAVNKAVEQDKEKRDAVIRVLNAMFSEDGQQRAATSSAFLSYNKNVNIEPSDAFNEVSSCVMQNHLYIRLASTEMFSVSRDVVQKMIRREYGAEGAFEDFNARLTFPKDTKASEIITVQNTAYDYTLGEHGSPAASAVLNTISKQAGSEIAVGYSSLITAPVLAGEYTDRQLSWLVANRVLIRQGQLTGAELKMLMDWLVSVKEDGSDPIRHKNLIPVTSGMEYTMTDNGDGTDTLCEITVNGAPIDENAVYSVIMLGDNNYIEAPFYCNCPMPEELNEKMELTDLKASELLTSALEGGRQLEAPTEYLTILN
ncbi:MAG: extracellular solute-binding protein [Oscillospiraceae bacterium]|nr:extracellular solute-binding protein [Oscillospiraceae bacterium]